MAELNPNETHTNGISEERKFLCGVVEGFYGRPWTPEQRKDLFSKQEKWGMNCYLYAPKDDYKHRAYWRELYTVEEAEHLQALITEARSNNIVFYYAISPGLDIAYSSQKEIAALKRKLEQVQQLGCGAFALLFDDIDPEMSGADKEVYQSFAHAQVSVANEVYGHLNQPKFMFCPTQYCSTRAVPTVQTSEYLNTLGSKLAPEIDIMWTGPKVISKVLTVEHIREVSAVLRRPPVIWDNLHANDYDQARVFMGPFCGRSPSLIPLLRGVFTNPNCEYGPNFVAINTLSQWARSASEENCCGDTSELKDDAISADIRLETEGDDSSVSYCPSGLPPSTYHPKRALRLALEEWLPEFNKSVLTTGPIQQPQIPLPVPIPIVPSVNTCMSLTSTTTVPPSLPTIVNNVNAVAEVIQDASLIPSTNIVMNSLVSETKIDTLLPEQLPEIAAGANTATHDATSSTSSAEPMDCNHSPVASPAVGSTSTGAASESAEDGMVVDQNQDKSATDAEFSPADSCAATETSSSSPQTSHCQDNPLTLDDLHLLVDLFYLPFEHGRKGVSLMTEFNWLKSNSHLVITHNRNNPDGSRKPEVQEWFDKAAKFGEMSDAVKTMTERLFLVRNRSLLYELYPYVWDMRGVVSLLNSYVQWLGFSKGWREAFMSGDQEPWIFRGGLTAELQRLIPVDASNDLFMYKAPEQLLCKTYVIRPYFDTDRDDLYKLVMQTADDGKDGSRLYEAHANLAGDVFVGSFLREKEDERIIMVVEDETGALFGYCCAATNARTHRLLQAQHLVDLRDQYPKVVREEGSMLTSCEQLLATLWDEPPPFPAPSVTPPVAMSHSTTPILPVMPPPSTSITPPESEVSSLSVTTSTTVTAAPLPVSLSITSSSTDATTAAVKPPVTAEAINGIDVSLANPAETNGSLTAGSTGILPSLVTPVPAPTPVGDLLRYYPALIKVAMLPTLMDESVTKRLTTCLLASLRAKGGFGGHACLPAVDKCSLELYSKLGFTQIGSVGDQVYLARSF
ncbi:protein O-GlcNAcase isoform X2 [Hyalella azteca]|uniref:protein O-GlcNAcase n=1 Tax=Hyalella azteca TaxID=294128 RepID=A0A8B7PCX5_HYAAZ|nr:protein O-GlcNAcase isoform X2 [Hyalella azteca]